MRMAKGEPFAHVTEDASDKPVFSYDVLSGGLCKDDIRFVLGVAEEYTHIIDALGPDATRALLTVNPRLLRRLGIKQQVLDWTEDAQSQQDLHRQEAWPLTLDIGRETAESVWQELHNDYKRYFDVAKSMDPNRLRTYNELTEMLGNYQKDERRRADEGRAEMTARAKPRQARRRRVQLAERNVLAALRGEGDLTLADAQQVYEDTLEQVKVEAAA